MINTLLSCLLTLLFMTIFIPVFFFTLTVAAICILVALPLKAYHQIAAMLSLRRIIKNSR